MLTKEIILPEVEAYLQERHHRQVHILQATSLGKSEADAADIKGFGYGSPTLIEYEVEGRIFKIVIRPVLRNGYGRERRSDRIGEVWRDYGNFSLLPHHVQAVDIVGIKAGGHLVSLKEVSDCLLVTEYGVGTPYAADLVRLSEVRSSTALDRERAEVLATYLANIHRAKLDDPLLWRRRLRDLIGHGEGVMGIIDGYPKGDWVSLHTLQSIEEAANRWRWRLKERVDRLSQVHGDFHPFNILFGDDVNFTLVDRSRGSWGEPADDVAALSINYLFFSLQENDGLVEPFRSLYEIFWQTYLDRSRDNEIVEVVPPWLAWRALVLASPQWYPNLRVETRNQLITFAQNVMANGHFDWQNIHHYFAGGS